MNDLFCERLVSLRKMYKVSQQKVADAVGIKQTQINKLEHGYIEANFALLIKLSKYFNVSVDYLLGVETQKQEVAPEFNQEQLQVVELIKKLNSKELEKVYNYLLGIIDARD